MTTSKLICCCVSCDLTLMTWHKYQLNKINDRVNFFFWVLIVYIDSGWFFLYISVPPSFETIMEDLDVCGGETSRFAVVVDGKPDPEILWYKVSLDFWLSCLIFHWRIFSVLSDSTHFYYLTFRIISFWQRAVILPLCMMTESARLWFLMLSLRMKGSTLALLRTWLGQCPVRLSLLFILVSNRLVWIWPEADLENNSTRRN